jgi:hypothetical protein
MELFKAISLNLPTTINPFVHATTVGRKPHWHLQYILRECCLVVENTPPAQHVKCNDDEDHLTHPNVHKDHLHMDELIWKTTKTHTKKWKRKKWKSNAFWQEVPHLFPWDAKHWSQDTVLSHREQHQGHQKVGELSEGACHDLHTYRRQRHQTSLSVTHSLMRYMNHIFTTHMLAMMIVVVVVPIR